MYVIEETSELVALDDPEPSDELCRTLTWRFDQLSILGFDDIQATLMAEDVGLDLAQACRLVAMGCPLETASRILL